jgi:plasmid stability protein
MKVHTTIRNIPVSVRDELAVRAGRQGRSLREFAERFTEIEARGAVAVDSPGGRPS